MSDAANYINGALASATTAAIELRQALAGANDQYQQIVLERLLKDAAEIRNTLERIKE